MRATSFSLGAAIAIPMTISMECSHEGVSWKYAWPGHAQTNARPHIWVGAQTGKIHQ